MSNAIKVTECWALPNTDGKPNHFIAPVREISTSDRPAILMWKEDYEAMRKELATLSNAITMLNNYLANDAQMDHALEIKALKIADRYKTSEEHES